MLTRMNLWTRWFGARKPRSIEIVETAYLPGGASLHVVRFGARTFALGRTPSAIAMLAEIETAEDVSGTACPVA